MHAILTGMFTYMYNAGKKEWQVKSNGKLLSSHKNFEEALAAFIAAKEFKPEDDANEDGVGDIVEDESGVCYVKSDN